MEDDLFWKLIAKADTSFRKIGEINLKPVIKELARHDDEIINGFREVAERLSGPFDTSEHWKKAGRVGDDTFFYQCLFNIALGREHYEKLLRDPNEMYHHDLEELLYVGIDAEKIKQKRNRTA